MFVRGMILSEQSLSAVDTPAAIETAAAVAALHLDRWSNVRPLLTVRVSIGEDGVGVRPLGSGLGLQIVLTVPMAATKPRDQGSGRPGSRALATIGVDQLPVARWGVCWEAIWTAAVANTRRLLRPTIRTAEAGSFRFVFVGGDAATSGVAADLDHFIGIHLSAGDRFDESTIGWWSVLSDQSVVAIQRAGAGSTVCLPVGLTTAEALVAHFRSLTTDPFPANLFAMPASNP